MASIFRYFRTLVLEGRLYLGFKCFWRDIFTAPEKGLANEKIAPTLTANVKRKIAAFCNFYAILSNA
jgi:hypothetical protein